MIIYLAFLLGMRNVSDKIVEKMKAHILCSIIFFFRKLCLLWDNVEECRWTGQATPDNMAHAQTLKATNTHTNYAKLIDFPLQQWLHEITSILRYMSTYSACLASICCRYYQIFTHYT